MDAWSDIEELIDPNYGEFSKQILKKATLKKSGSNWKRLSSMASNAVDTSDTRRSRRSNSRKQWSDAD